MIFMRERMIGVHCGVTFRDSAWMAGVTLASA
jgi:hypothetical protein